MANNAPVDKFQIGTVKAAVFKNQGKNGTFPSTKIENSFKKDEEWEPTDNYSTKELAYLQSVISEALRVHHAIEQTRDDVEDELDEAA